MSLLLIVLGAGPLAGGLRHPAAWSAAALALWIAASRGRPPALPAAPLWLAWLGWSLLSALSAPEPLRSLGAAGEGATALLVLAWAARAGQAERRRWLEGLLAWAPLLAAAAFWVTGSAQMTGLLPPYYNYTACFEAAAGAAGVAVLASASGPAARGERFLAAAACLAAATLLAASGSRGGQMALLAGSALALWRAGRKRAVLGLCAAAGLAAVLAPGALRDSWLKLDRPGANRRPSIWSAAVAVANDHPLLGEGPGRFEQGYLRHDFPSDVHTSRYNLTATHAHSEGLQAAAETGWLGLALLLAAWLATARAALGRAWARGDAVREAALAAAAAITIQGMFDNVLAMGWLRLLYFSALGLALPGDARVEPHARSVPWAWRAACLAGLLAAAWGRWPAWIGERAQRHADASPPAQALRALSWARALLPTEPALLAAEARAALRKDPPAAAAAERALSAARKASPYRAAYPQMLAELAVARRDWEAALRLSREAWAIEPEFLEARLVEAEALARLGMKPQAFAALERLEDARRRLAGRREPENAYDELISYLDAKRRRELLEYLGVEDAAAGSKT